MGGEGVGVKADRKRVMLVVFSTRKNIKIQFSPKCDWKCNARTNDGNGSGVESVILYIQGPKCKLGTNSGTIASKNPTELCGQAYKNGPLCVCL